MNKHIQKVYFVPKYNHNLEMSITVLFPNLDLKCDKNGRNYNVDIYV
jgi:hypothetical protein